MTENGLMDGTRTEKLFYNDSHLSKFTAMVLECEPYEKKEGCYAVELDRTAFFPEGGGQYADTGKLKDAKVSDVREKNGRILHITDQPFEAGEIVEGEIDWKTRFMKMQQHTGEHIVSGIVHARYGFNNVILEQKIVRWILMERYQKKHCRRLNLRQTVQCGRI